jgi:hypothetical protein
MLTVTTQNRLSELSNTLSFIKSELNKTELELRTKKADPSENMRDVSQRYCVLIQEHYRVNAALNDEVDKLMSFLESD